MKQNKIVSFTLTGLLIFTSVMPMTESKTNKEKFDFNKEACFFEHQRKDWNKLEKNNDPGTPDFNI